MDLTIKNIKRFSTDFRGTFNTVCACINIDAKVFWKAERTWRAHVRLNVPFMANGLIIIWALKRLTVLSRFQPLASETGKGSSWSDAMKFYYQTIDCATELRFNLFEIFNKLFCVFIAIRSPQIKWAGKLMRRRKICFFSLFLQWWIPSIF